LELIGVALESGAAFLPAAGLLTALWRRRGIAPEQARGAFHADPLAALASKGELPCSAKTALSELADLTRWTSQTFGQVTAVGVDTSPYHHAGATSAQDLAFAMATGVEYLRAMTGAGLDIDAAARQMLFRMSLGTHHFLAIGKLRAARRLWWQVVESCGGSASAGRMKIHARTSNRVLTRRDPHVNILRNSASVFAACLGGAEIITSVPFDSLVGLPDELSRRVARNTLLILQEEGHLHRVVDPAGGSWFLDTIADNLALKAWPIFQEIERQGGMLAALASGWVSEQIDASYGQRAKDIARRKEPITGVSEFPDVGEERVEHVPSDLSAVRPASAERVRSARAKNKKVEKLTTAADVVEAAARGATLGQLAEALGFQQTSTRILPLEARGFAEPFEALRDAADAWQAGHERRPRVFLANMGPIAHHTARAAYSKNFFEAGGFEVITNDGFQDDAAAAAKAFAESGATIAVICSSDKLYPELVPSVARQLKAAGARSVVLAGNPAENEAAWREAGVDRFIFIKCDVLATLREMLQEEGVLAT
jgi:methylmalonyl-CoA mutase